MNRVSFEESYIVNSRPFYFTAGVHLSLRNKLIPNNSYVVMDDIGSTDDTALLCHHSKPAARFILGDWFDPNGNKVGSDIDNIIIIIIRLYNTVGEENRVVREVNRDRLC